MNNIILALIAALAVFLIRQLQFFKKQTPLVNALVIGILVFFVARLLRFREGQPPGHTTPKSCAYNSPCVAGQYYNTCPTTGGSYTATCGNCPEGTYSTEPPGPKGNTWSTNQTGVGSGWCKPCPTNCAVCDPKTGTCTSEKCPAGQFLPSGKSTCSPCVEGTFSAEGAGSCTSCGSGTYSAGGATECTQCESGTYSAATGATSSATCTPCDLPNNCNACDAITGKCSVCATGYNLGTDKTCSPASTCPEGCPQNQCNLSSFQCMCNVLSSSGGNIIGTNNCGSGGSCTGTDTDTPKCTCDSGYHVGSTGACVQTCADGYEMKNGTCTKCAAGTAGTDGTCTACEKGCPGFYSDTTGATSCKSCNDPPYDQYYYAPTNGSTACELTGGYGCRV